MASVKRVKITRSAILFTAGLAGAAHEILLREDVRDGILVLLAGMMGLPAFLNHDENVKEKKAAEKNGVSSNESPPIEE